MQQKQKHDHRCNFCRTKSGGRKYFHVGLEDSWCGRRSGDRSAGSRRAVESVMRDAVRCAGWLCLWERTIQNESSHKISLCVIGRTNFPNLLQLYSNANGAMAVWATDRTDKAPRRPFCPTLMSCSQYCLPLGPLLNTRNHCSVHKYRSHVCIAHSRSASTASTSAFM